MAEPIAADWPAPSWPPPWPRQETQRGETRPETVYPVSVMACLETKQSQRSMAKVKGAGQVRSPLATARDAIATELLALDAGEAS